MTTMITWPPTLQLDNLMFELENISRGGGPSISGKEQVVASLSGRWTAKFETFLGSRNEVTCYRALRAALDGRAGVILISPCEPAWSPAALNGGTAMVLVTHSDTTTFSDGTEYEQDGTYCYLGSNANALDETLNINCWPINPVPGTYFSILDSLGVYRLHLITSAKYNDVGSAFSSGFSSGFGSGVTPQFQITIRPPLREAYLAGQVLNFGRPFCQMRLAADTSGSLTRTRSSEAKPQLSLVEVF